jgi:hypothetical protein
VIGIKGKGLGILYREGVHSVWCVVQRGTDGMEGNGRGGPCDTDRRWRGDVACG